MNNQILEQAAYKYGTPSYVFDLDAFARRIRYVKKALGERVKLCYAMKANPFLTATAAQEGDGLEVCSPGEYNICRRAGVSADKIVLSGVNKEAEQIKRVMSEQGARTYTAESPGQLKLLEECAASLDTGTQRVLLRLSSGNQFGMDEEALMSAISGRNTFPHLELAGVQYYSGTQKKDPGKIRGELEALDSLMARIESEIGVSLQELEYGPGFWIPYFSGEKGPDEEEILKDFKNALDSMKFKGTLLLEAGRFLAADCGSYITRVADTKNIQGRNYCIVDGGINHVNYYGQAMAMKIPPYRYLPQNGARREPGEEQRGDTWTVCGSLCTAGDILVKNLSLPGLEIGDLLIFDKIGAYSVTEGIYLFLSRSLPNVLFHTKAQGLRLARGAVSTDPINDGALECPLV